MKVTASANALSDAIAYAKASHHTGGVVLSKQGDLVIVTHANGHRRAFRQESGVLFMNRLIADITFEGFENLAKKGGTR